MLEPLQPVIGNVKIDLLGLYQMVDSMGGYLSVSLGNRWKEVAVIHGLTEAHEEDLKACYKRTIDMVKFCYDTTLRPWFKEEPVKCEKTKKVEGGCDHAKKENPQEHDGSTVMSSASSAITYTSVYTDSEPGRTPPVPQDEDEREPMFIQPHDPDYVPEPIYPKYIPLEDEHEFPAEEQPLPSVVSPTAESPGYVIESDLEEDPEEYEDDETDDGLVDYPMDEGDDGDDDDGDSSGDDADDEEEDEGDEDEEEEEEHLAPADSAIIVPTVELVSPLEGTEPVIPPPSTDITTTRARITVRLQASISLPPEAEVERLLAMPTPSPSPPISLSPPSAGERLARCTAPSAHSSPPPVPSPLLPSFGCPTQIQTLKIASTQALVDVVTAALPSPPLPLLLPSLYIPPPVDRRDDIPESERPPRKRSCLFALGSKYEVEESSTGSTHTHPYCAIVTKVTFGLCVARQEDVNMHVFQPCMSRRIQKYTRIDDQSFKDSMIRHMDFIEKYMLEAILHQQEIQQLLIEKKLQTQEVQSNTIQPLKVDSIVMENTCSGKENILSKEDLKGTRIENGFKWAFMSLFSQDVDTFTSTMLLNVDQLQKKLDKDEFQVDGSMTAFWVVNNQFQKFIDSQFSLDYDSQMIDKYFVKYTGIETKIDMGKAVDVDLVVIESSGTESEVQDESSRSGNDTDTDDAYIRPIYDKEPMAEVQLTAECNIFATGQQHTEQPEIINEDLQQEHRFSPIRLSDVYEKSYPRSGSESVVAEKVDISETSVEVDSKLISKMTFEHNGSSLACQCQRSSYNRYDKHDVDDRVGKSIRSFVR
ncbi:putative reverse transcriptase domain-containing protein [Tanacetum coccineum]|uniref:Reverse transcriptase domain-containing protein n=1 Tax=Tanacetum coccineum TaxID=301880 RepID=A0ABQ5BUS2_9ASTR